MAFSYVSRLISMALLIDKPLTQLSIVKVLDLVIARASLKILAAVASSFCS